ncbi:hypothetical protein [Paraburkholderia strydomiana]
MSNTDLQRKQRCANRLHFLAQEQVRVGRQIQQLNYAPTPELKAQMDSLIAEYDRAVADFDAASETCDTPVFVAIGR